VSKPGKVTFESRQAQVDGKSPAFLPEQAGASGRQLTDHLFNRNWAVRD
jgi:hypothetical protein